MNEAPGKGDLDPMVALQAGPLWLEPLLPVHAPGMFGLLCEPALYRYTDDSPPASELALLERYQRLAARRSPDGRQHWLNWVLRLPGGELAGYVQATVLPDGQAWIGYVLSPTHGGRGLATQAVDAMARHLAEAWGVTRLLASVEAANTPSIRLLERLGFTEAPAEAPHRGLGPNERLFVR
jgi:[ribosomal protein S5]-alanine N-acetyltransferase